MLSSFAIAQDGDNAKEPNKLTVVEPEFKGNAESDGIKGYVLKNLCYPEFALKCGIEGTEIIRFNLLPGGKLSEFRIMNSVSSECDEAVIAALKATDGMWSPGTIDGIPAAMEKELNVVFKSEGIEMYKQAQLNKGKADKFLEAGKYKKAVRYYNLAIKSCPHHSSPYFRRGMAKYHMGDMMGALGDFERVADMGSAQADPMLILLKEVQTYTRSDDYLNSIRH